MFKARFIDRNRINLDRELEVRSWTKHLEIERTVLEDIVARVGNCARAVRQEINR